MGREDESAWPYCDGGVGFFETPWALIVMLTPVFRMAMGLGMSQEEWHELRGQVDDSFWVMRVIGAICL